MTRSKPPACQTAVASPPAAVTSVTVTEPELYLWFYVTGASVGDVFATEYYTPSGQLYTPTSGAFEPLDAPGNWCFTDVPFKIAGAPPATLPGTWTVRVKYNNTQLFSLTFTIVASSSSGGSSSGITGYGKNLLQNPDGEAGTSAADCSVVPVPNWSVTGQFTTCRYGASDFPSASSPGPPNRGTNFFFGGYTDKSTGTQNLDVSWAAADIDKGNVTYTLSAYLGGYAGQEDNAVVRALFKASPFGASTQASIGPVTAAERNSTTGMLLRTVTGTVPAGTRAVDIVQEITRTSGSANDGYTDNLSFVLTIGGSGGTTPSGAIRLNINQVIDTNCPNNKVIVSVTDANGSAVTGLTASNFTLKEGGVVRPITVTPVGTGSTSGAQSLAIVIDISSSLNSSDLANEKAAAKQLIAQMSASDAVAVYSFGSNVTLVQDFTTDKAKLNAAVDSLAISGSTALYKAIQTASQALGARAGRKSMVLMTDGEDTVGGVTIDQAIAAAKQAGVPVFTVGFGSGIDKTVLTRIANETGGFFSTSASSADLQRILGSLGQVISSQYEISYTSGNAATDNTVEITVSVGGQTATASRVVNKCSTPGGGTGTTPTCNYFVQPLSQDVPAGSYSGIVQIFTGTGCTWTAASNVSWITVVGGASGNGNGAVSYRVDANSGAGSRTGTITIAGRTFTVTQAGGGAACAYSLSPSSNSMPALGGSSSFRITTGTNCTWTASTTDSWITLTSATSGTGSASISYTVGLNSSAASRTGTITAAGLRFTLTQSGGASTTGPNISQGGIVNAASNRAGTIARGSFFTIYGSNLGPAAFQQATSYPIPDTMGGVTVNITQGTTSRRAYLHFVSSSQINGIVPSNAPLGDVQITVSFNGAVSTTASATVVDTALGVFTAAGGSGPGIVQNYVSATNQPLNLPSFPAKPGQIVIAWATGLGPISTPDNQAPPGGDLAVPVEIQVGGKPARRLYSGRAPNFAAVDNIYFEVPADAPLGCSVPLQIKAGANWSNTVRMAISADGSACKDTGNPFTNLTSSGGKTGTIGLVRVGLSGLLETGKAPVDATLDLGMAIFSETKAGGELAFSPVLNLPPLGTCVSTNKPFDLGGFMGSGANANDPTAGRTLDAGAELTVTGPKGSVKMQRFSSSAESPYMALLGGSLPVEGSPTLPPFLEGGTYTVTGPGGKDVGPFTATITGPAPINWTNRGQITAINRSTPLTVTWSGGDASQTVLIAGAATDQKTKGSGGFVCLAPATAGTFTVPTSALADVPATGATAGLSDSLGMLAITSVPISAPPKFTASGIDTGYIFQTSAIVKTLPVQ